MDFAYSLRRYSPSLGKACMRMRWRASPSPSVRNRKQREPEARLPDKHQGLLSCDTVLWLGPTTSENVTLGQGGSPQMHEPTFHLPSTVALVQYIIPQLNFPMLPSELIKTTPGESQAPLSLLLFISASMIFTIK